MNSHFKKLAAPVAIVAILILYYAFLGFLISHFPFPIWGKALAILIPAALAGVGIYVLVQRIKEVRSGEEDDLGNY